MRGNLDPGKVALHYPKSYRAPGAGALLLLALAAASLTTLAVLKSRLDSAADPLGRFPHTILWVWEREEDLTFADPGRVGFAVLAKTLIIDSQGLTARPRMQPVRLPAGSAQIAVVRIETRPSEALQLDASVRAAVARHVLEVSRLPQAGAVQIDFDARESERPFYRALLEDLRKELPPGIPLSITALASWCLHDDWINDLPVDEAVPMLFRMGKGESEMVRHAGPAKDFRSPICRFSVGVSTDEWPVAVPAGRRLYIFEPEQWTYASLKVLATRLETQK